MRHPRELGAREVEAFLTYPAIERRVSASTRHQAPSAPLFLYRHMLEIELPWMDAIVRSERMKRSRPGVPSRRIAHRPPPQSFNIMTFS
jgi:hypothetical protein